MLYVICFVYLSKVVIVVSHCIQTTCFNEKSFGELQLKVEEQEYKSIPPKKPSQFIQFRVVLDFILGIIRIIPQIIYLVIKRILSKPKSIKGKICLVTGAGRGLGRELCLSLANLGAEIVCVDIREDINIETMKLIKDAGGKAHAYTCNIAKYQEVNKLAEKVQKEVGRVYMLVNNAALIMVHKCGEWPPEEVISMFNVNVISHYWIIQAFLPSMKEANEGHIVSILSAGGLSGTPGFSVYGATKAAGENMLCTLRMELNSNKNNNIEVTGIYPSIFNSSPDHCNFVETRLGFLGMETVVKKTIEAILHNETCVTVPTLLYYWLNISKCLPTIMSRGVYDILDMNVRVPNQQYKATIPFNNILSKCLETKSE